MNGNGVGKRLLLSRHASLAKNTGQDTRRSTSKSMSSPKRENLLAPIRSRATRVEYKIRDEVTWDIRRSSVNVTRGGKRFVCVTAE